MVQCPLCSFVDEDSYVLTLHVEAVHFSQESSTVGTGGSTRQSDEDHAIAQHLQQEQITGSTTSSDDDYYYLPCPEDCGEHFLWGDLAEHLTLHQAERLDFSEEGDLATADMYATHSFCSSSGCTPCHSSKTIEDIRYCVEEASRRAAIIAQATRSRIEAGDWSSAKLKCAWDVQDLPFFYQQQSMLAKLPIAHVTEHDSSQHNIDLPPIGEKASLGRHAQSDDKEGKRAQRLGKKELGPYAYEDRMPRSLYARLQEGAEKHKVQRIDSSGRLYTTTNYANEAHGIVPLLGRLLERDNKLDRAWLCDPSVRHVFKMKDEGGFCGFRNIQMMLSFILHREWPGWQEVRSVAGIREKHSRDRLPGVLVLQDMIERAWDMGYNSRCRVETGGIRGTRKYIGTPECQALLESLRIPTTFILCHDTVFKDPDDRRNSPAHEQLFDSVEQYFSSVRHPLSEASIAGRVTMTTLPPIYLQQPGHSLTIVGFERSLDGTRNILVLDPGYRSSAGIQRELEATNHANSPSSDTTFESQRGSSSNILWKPDTRTTPTKDGRIDSWVRRASGGDKLSTYFSSSQSSTTSTISSTSARSTDTKRKSELPSLRAGLLGLASNYVPSNSPLAPLVRGKAKLDEFHEGTKRSNDANKLLDAYRRGSRRLGRHREFELLMLVDPRDR